MNISNRAVIIFILAAIMSLAILPGCSGAKYRQAAVTNGEVTYSFEYPAYYTDPGDTLDGHMGTADGPFVSLRFTNLDDPESPIENLLEVNTISYSMGPYDAQAKAEDEIKRLEEIPELKGILLEQGKKTVAGVQAEYLVYTGMALSGGGPSSLPNPAYQIHVYFNYQGVIWHIGVMAEPELADRVKAEFNRILESFRFVD